MARVVRGHTSRAGGGAHLRPYSDCLGFTSAPDICRTICDTHTSLETCVGEEFAPEDSYSTLTKEFDGLFVLKYHDYLCISENVHKAPRTANRAIIFLKKQKMDISVVVVLFLKSDLFLFCQDRKVLLFTACEAVRQS